jgi:hypothetical protein
VLAVLAGAAFVDGAPLAAATLGALAAAVILDTLYDCMLACGALQHAVGALGAESARANEADARLLAEPADAPAEEVLA